MSSIKSTFSLPDDSNQVRRQIVLYLPCFFSCSIVERVLIDSNLHNTRPNYAHKRAFRATSPVAPARSRSLWRAQSQVRACAERVSKISHSQNWFRIALSYIILSRHFCRYSFRETFSYSASNNVVIYLA